MKQTKEEFKKKWMAEFKKHGGGRNVDPEITTKDPDALRAGLQESFDNIFPELMKKSKHRKHVIFDEDIFQFFEGLSENSGGNFSSLINSALRSFVRDRMMKNSKEDDPVAELLEIRERERELIQTIKELNLTDELKKKLG